MTGDFRFTREKWTSDGEFRMEGKLANSGEQVQFTLDVDAKLQDAGKNEDSTIDGTIEFLQAGPREVYLYLHSLAVDPSVSLFRPDRIANFAGQWWLLPPPDEDTAGGTVTPDPRLLQAQSEVIRVVRDRGFTTIDGRDAYQYDVEIDPEKLTAFLSELARERGEQPQIEEIRSFTEKLRASGTITIDAEDFTVKHFRWKFEGLPLPFAASGHASIDVRVRDHNDRLTITPPENVLLFSPIVFLDLPPRDADQEGLLSPKERDELLRELFESPKAKPPTP